MYSIANFNPFSCTNGRPESATFGPYHRLSRFTLNRLTLQIDLKLELVLLETPPLPVIVHDGGGMFIGKDRFRLMLRGREYDALNRPLNEFWEVRSRHTNNFHPFLD